MFDVAGVCDISDDDQEPTVIFKFILHLVELTI